MMPVNPTQGTKAKAWRCNLRVIGTRLQPGDHHWLCHLLQLQLQLLHQGTRRVMQRLDGTRIILQHQLQQLWNVRLAGHPLVHLLQPMKKVG